MTENVESSRTRDEDVQDKHVVEEQIPVTVEPEVDPEEDPEEAEELGGDSDGPLSPTSDGDLLQELHERNIELQARVQELEDQAAERQESLEQNETAVEVLTSRNLELKEKVSQLEYRVVELVTEKHELGGQLEEATVEYGRMREAWVRAGRRVDSEEREVRAKKARIDTMSFAYWTAVGRAQDRVRNYPVQYGQSRFTISRELVIDILNDEYYDGVRRGDL